MTDELTGIPKPVAEALKGPIKQSIDSVFDSLNHGVESLDLTGRYAKVQKERIKSMLHQIKLLGMHEPLELPDIYYPTQISTTIGRRLYKQEWLEADTKSPQSSLPQTTRQKKTIPGDEFFETHPKIVVLAGPGAGKTTFLKFIALAYSDSALRAKTALTTPCIPFFVSLPNYSRQKTATSLFDYIANPVKDKTTQYAVDFVKRCLVTGVAAVFLDSLDEVPISIRKQVIDSIKEFETSFPKARIVVSCRTADYEETLDNFHEVEIAKLTKDAITKIVKAWFGEDKQNAKRLLEIIENDDGVAGLTETPLLLSLLCIQFRHDLALPKRKVELYRRCVDALLRDWDATRGFRRETAYEAISEDKKERLFEHLAGRFFVPEQAYEFDRDRTVDCVGEFIEKIGLDKTKSEAILHEIECHHGIVERFSQDEYCFSHTSIQDYFVAKHLLAKNLAVDSAIRNH